MQINVTLAFDPASLDALGRIAHGVNALAAIHTSVFGGNGSGHGAASKFRAECAASDTEPTQPDRGVTEAQDCNGEDPAADAVDGDWNPYTAPVQQRYGKDKQAIIDAELIKRGVADAPKSWPTAKKHELLLEAADAEAQKGAAPESAKTVDASPNAVPSDVSPTEASAPVMSIEEFTTRFKAQAGRVGKAACYEILDELVGTRDPAEIPAGRYAEIIQRAEAVPDIAEDFLFDGNGNGDSKAAVATTKQEITADQLTRLCSEAVQSGKLTIQAFNDLLRGVFGEGVQPLPIATMSAEQLQQVHARVLAHIGG